MATNKNTANQFNYKNTKKLNKNFMYKDLKRSSCYDTDFSGSNFDYASFRGAHFKACNFFECTFKSVEFVGTNLKKSKFKKAVFENTLFESANLDGADFNGATFKNTIFLATDVTKASYLNLKNADVRIFDKMPEIEMSEGLEKAVKEVMRNEHVKASRVLDTKEGAMNTLSIMILLENFDEETLIKGLQVVEKKLDKSFSTLSYIIAFIKNAKAQGTF